MAKQTSFYICDNKKKCLCYIWMDLYHDCYVRLAHQARPSVHSALLNTNPYTTHLIYMQSAHIQVALIFLSTYTFLYLLVICVYEMLNVSQHMLQMGLLPVPFYCLYSIVMKHIFEQYSIQSINQFYQFPNYMSNHGTSGVYGRSISHKAIELHPPGLAVHICLTFSMQVIGFGRSFLNMTHYFYRACTLAMLGLHSI